MKEISNKYYSFLSSTSLLLMLLSYFLSFGNSINSSVNSEKDFHESIFSQNHSHDYSFLQWKVENEVLPDIFLINESENNENEEFISPFDLNTQTYFDSIFEEKLPTSIVNIKSSNVVQKPTLLFILYHCWRHHFYV